MAPAPAPSAPPTMPTPAPTPAPGPGVGRGPRAPLPRVDRGLATAAKVATAKQTDVDLGNPDIEAKKPDGCKSGCYLRIKNDSSTVNIGGKDYKVQDLQFFVTGRTKDGEHIPSHIKLPDGQVIKQNVPPKVMKILDRDAMMKVLDLKRAPDGTIRRDGFKGTYNLQQRENGSFAVYYNPGPGEKFPPQVFTTDQGWVKDPTKMAKISGERFNPKNIADLLISKGLKAKSIFKWDELEAFNNPDNNKGAKKDPTQAPIKEAIRKKFNIPKGADGYKIELFTGKDKDKPIPGVMGRNGTYQYPDNNLYVHGNLIDKDGNKIPFAAPVSGDKLIIAGNREIKPDSSGNFTEANMKKELSALQKEIKEIETKTGADVESVRQDKKGNLHFVTKRKVAGEATVVTEITRLRKSDGTYGDYQIAGVLDKDKSKIIKPGDLKTEFDAAASKATNLVNNKDAYTVRILPTGESSPAAAIIQIRSDQVTMDVAQMRDGTYRTAGLDKIPEADLNKEVNKLRETAEKLVQGRADYKVSLGVPADPKTEKAIFRISSKNVSLNVTEKKDGTFRVAGKDIANVAELEKHTKSLLDTADKLVKDKDKDTVEISAPKKNVKGDALFRVISKIPYTAGTEKKERQMAMDLIGTVDPAGNVETRMVYGPLGREEGGKRVLGPKITVTDFNDLKGKLQGKIAAAGDDLMYASFTKEGVVVQSLEQTEKPDGKVSWNSKLYFFEAEHDAGNDSIKFKDPVEASKNEELGKKDLNKVHTFEYNVAGKKFTTTFDFAKGEQIPTLTREGGAKVEMPPYSLITGSRTVS